MNDTAKELERAICGALMINPTAIKEFEDIVSHIYFYDPRYKAIIKSIEAINDDGGAVDILTVTQKLKSSGKLNDIGGPAFISSITNAVASDAHLEHHLRILQQFYAKRKLDEITKEIDADIQNSDDIFDLLESSEQKIRGISEKLITGSIHTMNQLYQNSLQRNERLRQIKNGISGIPSGFNDLDIETSGFQQTDLIILAARPGMGKTALALGAMRNAAMRFERPSAIFSLEMGREQLFARLAAAETEISFNKIYKSGMNDHDLSQYNANMRKLKDAPIYIIDHASITIRELKARARKLKYEYGVEIIFIDYIQLMDPGIKLSRREEEVSYITRQLKLLAKDLEMPIIALSQLNRSVESRGGDKKPNLSDLRESGAIEQDADMVIFIYRPEYYGIKETADGNSTEGLAELLIAKHRNGKICDIPLQFIGEFTKFTDYEEPREYMEPAYEGYNPE